MSTAVKEIKKALNKEFPSVEFQVNYDSKHRFYFVTWKNGLEKGATLSGVKSIVQKWATWDIELQEGDRIYCDHYLSEDWERFIAFCYSIIKEPVTYDARWQCLRKQSDGTRIWDETEWQQWRNEGVKSDLNDYLVNLFAAACAEECN